MTGNRGRKEGRGPTPRAAARRRDFICSYNCGGTQGVSARSCIGSAAAAPTYSLPGPGLFDVVRTRTREHRPGRISKNATVAGTLPWRRRFPAFSVHRGEQGGVEEDHFRGSDDTVPARATLCSQALAHTSGSSSDVLAESSSAPNLALDSPSDLSLNVRTKTRKSWPDRHAGPSCRRFHGDGKVPCLVREQNDRQRHLRRGAASCRRPAEHCLERNEKGEQR